jgi:capsular exopolysaccharide synthesis family protein
MAQYELNVLDYWLIIRKRKYTIVLTTVLVLLFTITLTRALAPVPIYESQARVKFDRATTVQSLLLEAIAASPTTDLPTQAEVIRSFPVLEQVARRMNLVPAEVTEDMRYSEAYLNVIYSLQQRMKTTQEGSTNIIRILVSSDSPEMSQQIANFAAEAYRQYNIDTRNRQMRETRQFVEDQLRDLERTVRNADQALRDFKEQEGQVFLDDEAKKSLDQYTDLEADYNYLLREKDEAIKGLQVLKSGTTPRKGQDRIFTEDNTQLIYTMNQRLIALLEERDTLTINYTPEHKLVRELDEKIANLKAEMVRELEGKVKNITEREGTLKGQIDKYRGRYLTFPKKAIELARLERDSKVNNELYSTLKVRHQEVLVKSAEGRIEEVTIIEPAALPTVSVNAPNTQLNMVVGSLMGLFLGIVLAFMRESFDTSIGTIEGVEEFLKLPVLGVIPRFDEKEVLEAAAKELPEGTAPETVDLFSKLVTLYDPKSVLAEAFRSLRTNVLFAGMDRHVKTLLFTSAGLGEGKSTVVINLAIALAQDGKRVLLVDSDLRKPIIAPRLGLPREPGLSEVLVGGAAWRDVVRSVTDLMLGTLGVDCVMNTPGLDNLNVLTSGAIPPNPAEFLNSNRLKDLILEMREDYDFVLFDTPPILPIADAVTVGSRVDAAVLVYQVGRVGRNALKRAKFLLEHAQAVVLGTILTNVRPEVTPEYAYYRYEYR